MNLSNVASCEAKLKETGAIVSVKNNFNGTWTDMNRPAIVYQAAQLAFKGNANGADRREAPPSQSFLVEVKATGAKIEVVENADGKFVNIHNIEEVYKEKNLIFQ